MRYSCPYSSGRPESVCSSSPTSSSPITREIAQAVASSSATSSSHVVARTPDRRRRAGFRSRLLKCCRSHVRNLGEHAVLEVRHSRGLDDPDQLQLGGRPVEEPCPTAQENGCEVDLELVD